MIRSLALIPALLATSFSACSTGSTLRQEPAPELVKRQEEIKAQEKKQRNFQRVIIQLDQMIDNYVTAIANRGDQRADAQAEKLLKLLQEKVLVAPVGKPSRTTISQASFSNACASLRWTDPCRNSKQWHWLR
jgi:hypothetical protein